MDLLDLATRLAGEAQGNEDVEAFLVHERSFEVKTYDDDVESLASAEPRGAGVRVVKGGRAGFAYTTDLTEDGLRSVVDMARTNADFTSEDEAVALASVWDSTPADVAGLIDPVQESVSAEDKVAFALELERATKALDERVTAVEEAAYSDSDTEVAIATSTGVSGRYRRTDAWCYSIAIADDGNGEREMGFDFGLARGLGSLDAEEVARSSVQRAVQVLGAEKIPSERMAVVFDPYVSGQFLGVISQALTAEAAQKGRSLFAGKVGEQVAAPNLTLVDDGRLDGGPSSAPWDDEGVPTGRTEVITGGVLRSFLYDTKTARRERRTSTGNASRAGFKSVPRPAPTNLAFEPTGETPEEILKRAGRALLVKEFHGVHSGANAVSGDFSVGTTGVLLANGTAGRPVKEVTIAAPMMDILKGITAVGADRRWLPFGGAFGGATTLVSEMTVAGA
ncbi:MAG: TldD/PmbA family protein [Actinomycetota bacterium]|nr:TldD/PmbA family protein [Actinomycetota bacterium]